MATIVNPPQPPSESPEPEIRGGESGHAPIMDAPDAGTMGTFRDNESAEGKTITPQAGADSAGTGGGDNSEPLPEPADKPRKRAGKLRAVIFGTAAGVASAAAAIGGAAAISANNNAPTPEHIEETAPNPDDTIETPSPTETPDNVAEIESDAGNVRLDFIVEGEPVTKVTLPNGTVGEVPHLRTGADLETTEGRLLFFNSAMANWACSVSPGINSQECKDQFSANPEVQRVLENDRKYLSEVADMWGDMPVDQKSNLLVSGYDDKNDPVEVAITDSYSNPSIGFSDPGNKGFRYLQIKGTLIVNPGIETPAGATWQGPEAHIFNRSSQFLRVFDDLVMQVKTGRGGESQITAFLHHMSKYDKIH